MKIGLRGSGKWSQNIARTLTEIGGVEIVRVTRDAEILGKLDGVIIANRSSEHVFAALPYIEAGIPTFIEKPMATNVSDAILLETVAEKCKTPVFVGHIYLFNEYFKKFANIMSELGTVESATCQCHNSTIRSDASVLWDWLPHCLSMLIPLFGGLPERVAAWSLVGGRTPQAAVVRYRFGESSGVCNVSWRSQLPRMELSVSNSYSTVVFDDKAVNKIVLYEDERAATILVDRKNPPLTLEIEAFLEICKNKTRSSGSLELAVLMSYCIEAAQKSIAMGGIEVNINYGTDRKLSGASIASMI